MSRARAPFSHLCRWCHAEIEGEYRNRTAYCSERCRQAMDDACKTVRLGRREIDALKPKPQCNVCGNRVDRLGTVYVDFLRSTVHLPGKIGWACCSDCAEVRRSERKLAEALGTVLP